MTAFTVRRAVVDVLRTITDHVVEEEPDALKPPAYVVKWMASGPSSRPGMMEHQIAVECWPQSDLQAAAFYAMRDEMTAAAMEVARRFNPGRAMGIERWDAVNDTRQLGGVDTRVAVVSFYVAEPTC